MTCVSQASRDHRRDVSSGTAAIKPCPPERKKRKLGTRGRMLLGNGKKKLGAPKTSWLQFPGGN